MFLGSYRESWLQVLRCRHGMASLAREVKKEDKKYNKKFLSKTRLGRGVFKVYGQSSLAWAVPQWG